MTHSIQPGDIIMSFDFCTINESLSNCFGIVYWNKFEDVRANFCKVYAFQVINGKRYHCNFLIAFEMINTSLLHDATARYIRDAVKKGIFTLQSVI